MRPVVFAVMCLGVLVGCEPEQQASPVTVEWLEWPAEVAAATPFPVRLRGYDDLPCVQREFVIAPRIDTSIVTFEPYFLHRAGAQPCNTLAARPLDLLVPVYWDTTVSAPGLSANRSTYEMRAKADDNVRTFGEVVVRAASTGRINAAGSAFAERDMNGCMRVRPPGLVPGYALENPPDTVSQWTAFVKGYLYEAASPVCGETRVFHLVARN